MSLVKRLIPAVEELIALAEYYDSPTYHHTVQSIVTALEEEGVVRFNPTNQAYDPALHDVHEQFEKDIDAPRVSKCWVCGYRQGDEIIQRAIVDIWTPAQ